MLSPEQISMLRELAQTEDLPEARRLCAAFLQKTAAEPQKNPTTPEGLLSALLTENELSNADRTFGKLTGRVFSSFSLLAADADAYLNVPMPPDCWQMRYGSCLVIVAASTGGPVVMEPLQELLRKQGISAGVSRPFDDLSGLRQAYSQASATLRTIRILGRSNTVGFYDDFLMIRLLELIPHDVSLSGFCLPDIQALQEYDKTHDSELCRTLLCYLEHARNASSTARALNVHRNTIHYRIGKCKEIMPGLDFQNDYITFLLMVSLHIAEYDFYRQRVRQIMPIP